MCLLAACGGDSDPDTTDETVTARDSGAKDSSKGKSDAGKSDPGDDGDDGDEPTAQPGNGKADAGGGPQPGTTDAGDDLPTVITGKCDYEDEEVKLTKDLVIPAGKQVHVCPGTTFIASTDVKINVLGALLVDGSSEKPGRHGQCQRRPERTLRAPPRAA